MKFSYNKRDLAAKRKYCNQMMGNWWGINLALMRRFESLGIEFAYPTQTLIVEKAGEAAAG